MPQSSPSFEVETITAAALLALAIVFIPLCWGASYCFNFCVNRNLIPDDITSSRVYVSGVLIKLLLIVHYMNISIFLLSVSTWTQLQNWYRLLLPEKANNLILLISYLCLLSIWKHGWGDINKVVDSFVEKPPGPSAIASQTHA
jgi:hypothetical protein